MRRLAVLALCAILGATTACTASEQTPATLHVLASSELADMQPVLDDLRQETGIELVMDYRGTIDATNALTPGNYQHDLAWLSSDRYFQLKLAASHYTGQKPLSASIMSSPLVIGMKPQVAERLRQSTPDHQVSWADIAAAAATGSFKFAMADPHHTGTGLAALVGVATAAAGGGRALRPEDVTCDRLAGFRTGQTLTANTSTGLVDEFVKHQGETDALVIDESVLLSLNASGKLREPLEIVYPEDGIVLSEYPLLLLKPEQRATYDRLLAWLRQTSTQKKIMERTLRRPLNPDVPRDPRLQTTIGNSLYFPDQPEVIDKLLANYDTDARNPGQVIFLLDFSGSMRGDRLAALRSTFAGLSGADSSSVGKFLRFYQGERFILSRFGGRVLGEQSFSVGGANDVSAMQAFLATEDLDQTTAIWSALDHGYQLVADLRRADPRQPVTIVLMTDGESNAGMSLDEFLRRYESSPPEARAVHTYTIRFGEANPGELDRAARATGGHMVDANATSLNDAFKETRGCR